MAVLPVAAIAQPGERPSTLAALDANPAPSPVHVVKSETMNFDYWTVACDTLSVPANARKCVSRLKVFRANSRDSVVVLTVGANAKGDMRLDVQIPTSTSIAEGVIFKTEGGDELKLPIAYCDPASCVASTPYSAKVSTLLQSAAKVTVVWTSMIAGEVKVDFGVNGAREALAALSTSMAAGAHASGTIFRGLFDE